MKGKGRARPGVTGRRGKNPQVGSGGQKRQALEGRGPTPKAEDRPYHPAGKRKAAAERYQAAGGGVKPGAKRGRRGEAGAGRGEAGAGRGTSAPRRAKTDATDEVVAGRNAVVEALRARIPVTALYLASRLQMDDRIREILKIVTDRGIPVLEVMRPELDRLTSDAVHQGVAIKVPPYQYSHPGELIDRARKRGERALVVALDGITDPRNLGAIIRSAAAFGAHGVIVPQRRSVGVTAAAWKTSAGAAARLPVAMASNLNQTLAFLRDQGVFVLGLDAGGDVLLPGLSFADRPLVIVVGAEGKGLSRLVRENCDAVVSIPISAATESLNAGVAASVALYEIARLRMSE